jgi:sensor histidine kinase YesM
MLFEYSGAIITFVAIMMAVLSKFFRNNVVQHVVAWICILFFTALRFTLHDKPFSLFEDVGYNVAYAIPQVIMAYLMLYVLIPKLFVPKHYLSFGVVFMAALYVLAFMARLLMVHVAEPMMRPEPFEQESVYVIATDLGSLFGKYAISIMYVVGTFLAFVYFKAYHHEREKALLLAAQKSEAELRNLRAQLHPHFLFNTLNNIYSLSLQQSPHTSVAIAKLSELLDYTLYRSNANLAPISAELSLVISYIELEKLRYSDRLKIGIESDLQHDGLVPPLVFLSLVENAFKHGSGEDLYAPSIQISLKGDHRELRLSVANTYTPVPNRPIAESIGLRNIRLQLEALFPQSHALDIRTEGNWFKVHLYLKYPV